MIRQAARGALALVLVAAVLDSAGFGRQGTADKVSYRDKKDGTIRTVDGELKPGPAGFQVVEKGKVNATVAGNDIVRVVPGDLPGLERTTDVLPMLALEDKKDYTKARDGYLALQKKVANPQEKTRRYLEFKVATLAAKVADDTADDANWQAKADEAVTLLGQFLTAYPTGWEAWPVGRTEARLQFESGKFQEAARTWAKLAASKDLPADLKQDAALQEIDALIRGKRAGDASARIGELLKSAPAGPVKEKLAVYQAAAKAVEGGSPDEGAKLLQAEVEKTKDPAVRAVAYSMLGEVYMAADRPRDAMWAFLWVEVVYNQDRDEVAKAMSRIADSFKAQGDDDRHKASREKLRRFRLTL